LKVVHLVVPVEELRESSSEDEEVIRLAQEMESNLGDVLGISLSEVQARYFGDSDTDKEPLLVQNYGGVIESRRGSGQYLFEDMDGLWHMIVMLRWHPL
jgi:hypothetical protein